MQKEIQQYFCHRYARPVTRPGEHDLLVCLAVYKEALVEKDKELAKAREEINALKYFNSKQ